MKPEWVSLITYVMISRENQTDNKLEKYLYQTILAKLDGTTEKVKSRLAQHTSIEVCIPPEEVAFATKACGINIINVRLFVCL